MVNIFGYEISDFTLGIILLIIAILIWLFRDTEFRDTEETNEDEEVEKEEIEEADEENYETCEICKKKVVEDKNRDIDTYECNECSTTCCDDCCFQFENADIILCKNCINEKYPREEKIIEKYIDKIIEIPISQETKTKKTKSIL